MGRWMGGRSAKDKWWVGRRMGGGWKRAPIVKSDHPRDFMSA